MPNTTNYNLVFNASFESALLASRASDSFFWATTSSSLDIRPPISCSTSRATSASQSLPFWPESRSRPIRLTKTPSYKTGYDPTWIPWALRRSWSDVRYGAIIDSGRLFGGDEHHETSWIEGQKTYSVNIWILKGRSCFGGKGRNGVKPCSIFVNKAGIPGKTQSFPSRRTTGYTKKLWLKMLWKGDNYHPDILRDKEHFRLLREKRHSESGSPLFIVLGSYPPSMSVHPFHTINSLLVMHEFLIEGFC